MVVISQTSTSLVHRTVRWCTGHHNVEVGKCYLAEPWDENSVSLVLLFCVIDSISRTRFITTSFNLSNIL
jgi:hypothetical protein